MSSASHNCGREDGRCDVVDRIGVAEVDRHNAVVGQAKDRIPQRICLVPAHRSLRGRFVSTQIAEHENLDGALLRLASSKRRAEGRPMRSPPRTLMTQFSTPSINGRR
jgi:hypothetical protein